MWRLSGVFLSLALSACQTTPRDSSPDVPELKTAPRQEASPSATTNSDVTDIIKDKMKRAQLRAAQSLVRKRDYDRQKPGPIPMGLPASLKAVIPRDIDLKVIGFEVHRDMTLVQPTPTRLFLRLRMLTLANGVGLRKALYDGFRSAGWVTGHVDPRSPIIHPKRGRLTWTILEPTERPTTIDLNVEAKVGTHMISSIETLLRKRPLWWSALNHSPIAGYEYSWFHGVHFGGVFSDLERISLHLSTPSNQVLDEAIYAASRAAGYAPDDDNARMMRGPERTTLFVRLFPQPGGLVAHHQRRWGMGHRKAPKRP
jgi:hypothetical protein